MCIIANYWSGESYSKIVRFSVFWSNFDSFPYFSSKNWFLFHFVVCLAQNVECVGQILLWLPFNRHDTILWEMYSILSHHMHSKSITNIQGQWILLWTLQRNDKNVRIIRRNLDIYLLKLREYIKISFETIKFCFFAPFSSHDSVELNDMLTILMCKLSKERKVNHVSLINSIIFTATSSQHRRNTVAMKLLCFFSMFSHSLKRSERLMI